MYIDTIDAVTTQEMGRKAYATRVDFKWMDFKYRYLLYYGRYNDFFGKRRSPWTCRCCRQGYISYQLEENTLVWVSSMQAKIAFGFGITTV
jgi:hypothetical protein